jgi:hypothetical protein
VTHNISLTFEAPYPIDLVKLHMPLTMWESLSHGQCRRSYLTFWAALSHWFLPRSISLTFSTSLSHFHLEPPYVTDSMHNNISPNAVTSPLSVTRLTLWNIRHQTQFFLLQPPHWFCGPRSSLSVEYRQFTFSGNAAKFYRWLTPN